MKKKINFWITCTCVKFNQFNCGSRCLLVLAKKKRK